jgi:hypothetical protein
VLDKIGTLHWRWRAGSWSECGCLDSAIEMEDENMGRKLGTRRVTSIIRSYSCTLWDSGDRRNRVGRASTPCKKYGSSSSQLDNPGMTFLTGSSWTPLRTSGRAIIGVSLNRESSILGRSMTSPVARSSILRGCCCDGQRLAGCCDDDLFP